MSDHPSETEGDALPIEVVSEELIGINMRGLRSLRTVWTRPRLYFAAAKLRDWGGTYTPAIRLWLFFFAVFSALKFWWIGSNDGLIEAYRLGYEQAGLVAPPGMNLREIGREALLRVFAIWPVLQIIGMVALAFVFPFWGRKTSAALRQRQFFATILPSVSLTPIFMTAMLFVPHHAVIHYSLGLAIVTLLIDFQTGYRGAMPELRRWSRAWRIGLLSLSVMALSVFISLLSQMLGILYVSWKYSFPLAG